MSHSPVSPFDAAGIPSGMTSPPLRLSLHRVNGRRVHGAAVALPQEGAVLGSAPLSELLGLHLDASLHIARNHARIMPLCGHWMLSLADEHMVCAVNGSKVPWGELYTLAPGDCIQLGFTELRVESAQNAPLSDAAFFAAVPVETPHAAASQDLLLSLADVGATLPDPMDSGDAAADASASLRRLCLGEADAAYTETQDKDAKNTGEDGDAGLSPEAALLQQLGTDFAASATSRALHYQAGQPLDAILAPVPTNPALAGLVSLLSEDAPAPRAPLTPAAQQPAVSPDWEAPTFLPHKAPAPLVGAEASSPTDQDFFAQLAQPRPLHDLLSPPSFSVAAEATPEAMPSLSELLDTQDAALTLEDILDGPLQIDDVLRSLEETASAAPDATFSLPQTLPASRISGMSAMSDAFGMESPFVTDREPDYSLAPSAFTLDVLQQEIPPDPLTLLGGPGDALPTSAWDAGLSPLLRREHHQPDLHTPYTLASVAQAAPQAAPQATPKAPHDKEPA